MDEGERDEAGLEPLPAQHLLDPFWVFRSTMVQRLVEHAARVFVENDVEVTTGRHGDLLGTQEGKRDSVDPLLLGWAKQFVVEHIYGSRIVIRAAHLDGTSSPRAWG